MKIPVKAAIFLISIILMVMIFMALTSTSARANEGEESLAGAVEKSLEQLKENGGYQAGDQDEWLAEFHRTLLAQISSDSDITVDVLHADMEKGILDISVKETFPNIANGKQKEVVCRKTVLFEEHPGNHEKKYHTIRFQLGDTLFRAYTVYTGSRLVNPGEPEAEGKAFRYWKLEGEEGAADLEQLEAAGDMTFQAVFE